MKIISINPKLYNAPEKLRDVRKLGLNVPEIMLVFVEYMATIAESIAPYNIEKLFIPETMWSLGMTAMDNIRSVNASPKVPSVLKEKLAEVIYYKDTLFDIMDKMANDEFAEKFRYLGNPIH